MVPQQFITRRYGGLLWLRQLSGPAWTVTQRAEGRTPVAHQAGWTARQIVTAAALGSVVQVVEVKGFGAKGNGTTDDIGSGGFAPLLSLGSGNGFAENARVLFRGSFVAGQFAQARATPLAWNDRGLSTTTATLNLVTGPGPVRMGPDIVPAPRTRLARRPALRLAGTAASAAEAGNGGGRPV